MKKILLLFCALLTMGVSGAWADVTVTINDQTDLAEINGAANKTTASEGTATHKYGVYSGSTSENTPYYTTFTTNWTSGLADLVISSTDKVIKPTYLVSGYYQSDYGHVIAIQTSGTTASTITITAPSGYKIKNYSMRALSTSDANYFNITPSGGSTEIAKGVSKILDLSVNVNATSSTFTVARATNTTSTLCISQFVVTLEKIFPFTYTVNDDKGTFYSGSTVKVNGYGNKWLSKDTDAQLSMTTNSGNNNMVINVQYNSVAIPFRIHTDTYDLAVPFGYIITGWSITGYTNYTNATSTIKGTTISTNSASPTIVSASGLISRTTSFDVSTASPWITVNSMSVTIAKDPKTYIDNLGDLSNTKTYIIYGGRGCWNTASTDATSMTYVGTNDINKDDTKQQIALISGTQGRIYAYSVTAGKFLNGSATSGDPIGLSDTPEPIYITSTGNIDYPWFFSFTDDKSAQNINISSSALKVMDNNTLDEGNRWCICEANTSYSVPAAATSAITTYETAYTSVIYRLKYNGNVVATVEHPEEVVGTTVSASTIFGALSEPEYSAYDDPDVATIAANTTEVNIDIIWTGPFEISTSYADATWYYMKLKGEYLVYSTTAPYQFYIQEVAVAAADNALWAFVGDPYNGVRIINYAAGNGKYLNVGNTVQMSEGTYPRYSLCTIEKNAYGFVLNNEGAYIHHDDQGLKWGNSDWRSTLAAAITLDEVNWKNVALAKLTLFARDQHVGDYFGVMEGAITSTRGYINDGVIASATRVNYDAAVEYFYSTVALSVKKPESGYYRFYNSTRNRYMGTEDGNPMTLESGTSASTVVKLVYDDSGKTYKIQIQGKELNAPAWNTIMTFAEIGSGAAFTAEGKGGMGAFKNGYYVHAGGSGHSYKLIGYSAPTSSDSGSGWTVEKVTEVSIPMTTVGNYTYTTLGLPFGVALPDNVKAYILKVENDYAVPYEISEVPAGEGVLLRGTSSSVTSATLTIKDNASAITIGNKLVPTYVDITSARVEGSGEYILGNGSEGLGFYKRGTGKIGANKAYLDLGSDISGVKGFILNFDEDAIKSLDSVSDDKSVYDLSGRRVAQPTRGLYIVNGKKVLIK